MYCKIRVFSSKIDKISKGFDLIYEVGDVVGATHGRVYAVVLCKEQKWH